MKRFVAFLFAFSVASAPAFAASIYDMRNVGRLLASTPAVTASKTGGRITYQVKGGKDTPVPGFVTPASIDDGFLANGQELLIVPLDSGGSGGVFTTLLYTNVGGKWQYVGNLTSDGGHVSVYIQSGQINEVYPLYAAHDPNCCPSKHRHLTYSLSGTRLKQTAAWETP